jgi:beta-galactosidase
MKKAFPGPRIILLLFSFTFIHLSAQDLPERNILFDQGWKFHLGGAQGAENPSFNDSAWRNIDLPHDWSIEDLPGIVSPFSINAVSQVSGGFTTGGTGWYRKAFSIPSSQSGKCFRILFEGVYMNAEVYLNGIRLGEHPYGYTSFWYDITDKMKPGSENMLAVKVRNEGENSRWYSGSGIYRHVWLQVLDPVHIGTWGVSVTTQKVTSQEAWMIIRTTVVNKDSAGSKITLASTVLRPDGLNAGESQTDTVVPTGEPSEISQRIVIRQPELWSTELPVLYRLVSEIRVNGNVADRKITDFGIRTISFDAVNGFILNGKPMKLKGGCIHHDNGPLGAKAYDRAEERKAQLLKSSGFNAIRTSHNPPSPALLNACDRLGMLVMDEAFDMWNEEKNPADYHLYFNDWWKEDVRSMILRDRNHPSVIMWSIGNEIPNRHKPEVIAVAGKLAAFVRNLDPSRPVTSAVNDLKPDKDPYFAVLDVAGYNYASGGDHNQQNLYELDHDRVPSRIMAGTESFPLEAFGSWMDVLDHPYVIGDFVWTAFDYIGEASIGWRGYFQKQDFFPWNLAFCGDIDICGWKRPQSYYRDALWKENQLTIWVTPPVPSFEPNPERQSWSKWQWLDAAKRWNWEGYEGKELEVTVYSSCEQVELFLNGRSLGKKPVSRQTKFMATWKVGYEPGILSATGFTGKKKAAAAEIRTSGAPANIRLTADRSTIKADGQDLCYVTVEIEDSRGINNPLAENDIRFSLDGPGKIIGVGNANPVSLESFVQPVRKAWHGRCLAIIRSGKQAGKIILKATADGLNKASIEITSK